MGIGEVRRANADVIISHWCKLIENLKASPGDFYRRLHQVIVDRKIPNLEEGSITWRERGPSSAKGPFFRLLRERIGIESCAARIGTGSFVSWRLGEMRLKLKIIGLLVLLAAIPAGMRWFYIEYFFQ